MSDIKKQRCYPDCDYENDCPIICKRYLSNAAHRMREEAANIKSEMQIEAEKTCIPKCKGPLNYNACVCLNAKAVDCPSFPKNCPEICRQCIAKHKGKISVELIKDAADIMADIAEAEKCIQEYTYDSGGAPCNCNVKSAMHNDPVNHPSHYTTGGIEVLAAIEAWELPYHLGNVVKYMVRAGKKNPDKEFEDLKKAQYYLNRYIKNFGDGENEKYSLS